MTERISTQARLGEILSSLGEPTRRKIVDALGSRQLSVMEIVEIVGISQPAASKHLKILREAGVIVMRPDAQRRLYRVSRDAFSLLGAWADEIASNAKPVGTLHEDLTVRPAPVMTTPQPEGGSPRGGALAPGSAASAGAAPGEAQPSGGVPGRGRYPGQQPAQHSRASAPRRANLPAGTGSAGPAAASSVPGKPAGAHGDARQALPQRSVPGVAPGTAAASSSTPSEIAADQKTAGQKDEEQSTSFLHSIPQLQNLPGLPRLSRFTRRLNGK